MYSNNYLLYTYQVQRPIAGTEDTTVNKTKFLLSDREISMLYVLGSNKHK